MSNRRRVAVTIAGLLAVSPLILSQEAAAQPSVDLTRPFQRLYGMAQKGVRELPTEARRHVYLMVGGLFSASYPGYNSSNIRHLQSLGLDVRRSGINTGASVRDNAKVIRDEIMRLPPDAKVVIITQSKGSVDAKAALQLYPELTSRVRAFIAKQGPFDGSPIVDDVQRPSLKHNIDRLASKLFGADPRAIEDLSTAARREFDGNHPYPTEVPTLTLATSRLSWRSLLGLSSLYLRHRHKVKSDGLVPESRQAIPGTYVATLKDMDHAESVFRLPRALSRHSPGALDQVLITVALSLPEPQASAGATEKR